MTYEFYNSTKQKSSRLQRGLANITKELELQDKIDNLGQMSLPTPDPCKNCSNNPINGGSGVCLCTLGLKNIVYY